MEGRFESQIRSADPGFQTVIRKIPLQVNPPLPQDWLRSEMLERYFVLQHAPIRLGSTVLEVGAGSHAISTVPLAHFVGRDGRIVAVERRRWEHFRATVSASGLAERICPVAADARRLPFRDGAVNLAACIHGLRSLQDEDTTSQVFREMLRVAGRVFLAETLPIARTDAQRAHLGMYDLREEVFLATTGRPDDLRYRPLSGITALVERAGGVVESSRTLEVDLPHALAYFPRAMAEAVPNSADRARLVARWDEANAARLQFGEDHPPVGIVVARAP